MFNWGAIFIMGTKVNIYYTLFMEFTQDLGESHIKLNILIFKLIERIQNNLSFVKVAKKHGIYKATPHNLSINIPDT